MGRVAEEVVVPRMRDGYPDARVRCADPVQFLDEAEIDIRRDPQMLQLMAKDDLFGRIIPQRPGKRHPTDTGDAFDRSPIVDIRLTVTLISPAPEVSFSRPPRTQQHNNKK